VITIAHFGDLRIGSCDGALRRAYALRDRALAAEVDHLVVTGDLTEHGDPDELLLLRRALAPLLAPTRATIVPGPRDAPIARRLAGGAREPLHGLAIVDGGGAGPALARLAASPADAPRLWVVDELDAQAPLYDGVDLLLCRRAAAAPSPHVHEGRLPALFRFDRRALVAAVPLEDAIEVRVA
jgi:hypothetical protein